MDSVHTSDIYDSGVEMLDPKQDLVLIQLDFIMFFLVIVEDRKLETTRSYETFITHSLPSRET